MPQTKPNQFGCPSQNCVALVFDWLCFSGNQQKISIIALLGIMEIYTLPDLE